jgi:hydroxymethylpyrimidine/phosphomethylpyrimidine kinase
VPNVLAVAGSDSGGGAGIQADLKTFAAFEVYGCTAVTAVTAQNTTSVRRAAAVSAAMVEAQMEAVFGDIRISAVKVGLLPTASVVRAVARVLARYEAPDVVYDPVMAASTGRSLQAVSALDAVRAALLPRVTVVTPNVDELARLTGSPPPRTDPEVDRAARLLLDTGAGWVLVTGGHRPGRFSRDRLHGPRGSGLARWYRARRVATRHGHGTGCTLSSAIAARLALGDGVPEAVEAAKAYLGGALAAAGELNVGLGPGPLNHFFAMWRKT